MYELSRGRGRTKVNLVVNSLGSDPVVFIYNKSAHIGAVALGEYSFEQQRTSVSVTTRLGHKDDVVAQKAAYLISKSLQKAVCVIAGIHLDDITEDEVNMVTTNANILVQAFIKSINNAQRATL